MNTNITKTNLIQLITTKLGGDNYTVVIQTEHTVVLQDGKDIDWFVFTILLLLFFVGGFIYWAGAKSHQIVVNIENSKDGLEVIATGNTRKAQIQASDLLSYLPQPKITGNTEETQGIEPIMASCMLCPKCQNSLGFAPNGASECPRCEQQIDVKVMEGKLFAVAVRPVSQRTIKTELPPEVDGSSCHQCENNISSYMEFCPKCGTKQIKLH
jgi:ssDNA-binding Zn-finger/Zn-ribbon topoisomerase 1